MGRRRPHLTVVADQSVGGDPVFSASSPRAFSTWRVATSPFPLWGRAGEGVVLLREMRHELAPPNASPQDDFLRTLNQRDCACNIHPPASSYAIMRRAGPYCGGRFDVSKRGPSRPTRRLGTNPEQLFAAGWLACFEGAIASLSLRRSSLTYLVTWTFFASTPGVAAPAAGGFPAMSGDVGRSLLKDLVLLAASLCLLLNSLGMTSRRA
jgi:hypothetical protein